jgi:hypothetical protein
MIHHVLALLLFVLLGAGQCSLHWCLRMLPCHGSTLCCSATTTTTTWTQEAWTDCTGNTQLE